MKSYLRGIFAEYYVSFYLRCCGFQILRRRYKTRVGEIDLIARKGRDLYFIEVKNHKHFLQEAIRLRQMSRIRCAAEVFMSKSVRDRDVVMHFYAAFVRGWRISLIEDDFLR